MVPSGAQYIKLKLDGDQGITKLRYNGENLQQLRNLVPKKYAISGGFDLFYTDEDNEQVSLNDAADWRLFTQQFEEKSYSKGSVDNLVLTVKPHSSAKVGSVYNSNPPAQIITFVSGNHTAPNWVSRTINAVYKPSPSTASSYSSTKSSNSRLNDRRSNATPVHVNVMCDQCKVGPIKGNRFKSVLLNNFDLCEKCQKMKKFNRHPFILIPYYDKEDNNTIYAPHQFRNVIENFKDTRFPAKDNSDTFEEKVEWLLYVYPYDEYWEVKKFVQDRVNLDRDSLTREYVRTRMC